MTDNDGSGSNAAPSEQMADKQFDVPPNEVPGPPLSNTGRPPLSPLPHRRGQSSTSQISDVSLDVGAWDSKAVADVIEEAERLERQSSSVSRRLKLADINEASPMETEAETLLLQALEEQREESPQTESAVLPHVPDESLDALQTLPVELSDSEVLRFQAAADQVRSSKTGTKGKLAGLTQAMRLLHEDTAANLTAEQSQQLQVDSSFIEPVEQEIPSSDTDTFLNNANALFRRTTDATKRDEEVTTSLSSSNNDPSPSSDSDVEHGTTSPSEKVRRKHRRRSRIKRKVTETGHGIRSEICVMHDFLEPRKGSIFTYCKWMMLGFILPLFFIALVLFYAGNPWLRDTGASVSWLCLFILRNLITFSLAKGLEVYTIGYLCLRKKVIVKVSYQLEPDSCVCLCAATHTVRLLNASPIRT